MGLVLEITKREADNVVVCSLKGPLDTETYRDFMDKIIKYLAKPLKGVILDLKLLEYISSMGVSAILDVRRLVEKEGGSFIMANVPANIEEVFRVVKIMPLVQVFGSLKEADKFLMGVQGYIKK